MRKCLHSKKTYIIYINSCEYRLHAISGMYRNILREQAFNLVSVHRMAGLQHHGDGSGHVDIYIVRLLVEAKAQLNKQKCFCYLNTTFNHFNKLFYILMLSSILVPCMMSIYNTCVMECCVHALKVAYGHYISYCIFNSTMSFYYSTHTGWCNISVHCQSERTVMQ